MKSDYDRGYAKGYEQAMRDINKPVYVKYEKYEPGYCPKCGESFWEYEKCVDGQWFRNLKMTRCPECGQKIKV